MLLLTSCEDKGTAAEDMPQTSEVKTTKPDIVIAADSMPVKEEQLNDFYFAVKLQTTEYTANYGTYKVVAHWGHNNATTEFSMPKGGEDLKPVLKRGTEPYTYDIGFYYKDEPEFYDYYRVSGDNGDIKMKYLKAYSFK